MINSVIHDEYMWLYINATQRCDRSTLKPTDT